MRAVELTELSESGVFRIIEREARLPGPTEVAIQVHAASVNVVDTKLRFIPDFAPDEPTILGCDVAGVITHVGDAVTKFKVGDEVFGCAGGVKGHDGAYQEQMICDARLLAKKPSGVSYREAAALPLVAITAWESLVDRARVKAGDRVLVHGGAGGVGHIGIQLANALGAVVHATVSDERKARIAAGFGAATTINYRDRDVETYVAEETGGAGYDVVFDTVGSENIGPSLAAVATNGQVASTVSLETAPNLSALHLKNASLHVIFMLIPMLTGRDYDRHGEILERVAAMVDAGHIRPLIDEKRFTLESVADAHAHLESGAAVGKIVIDVIAA